MKYIKNIAAVLCLAALVGCATANTTAFRAYGTSRVTAHAALVEWNAYLGVADPKPSPDTERKVLHTYNEWRATMLTVADAGAIWSAATLNKQATASDVDAAFAAFNQAVAHAAELESDFIHMVAKFTGKPL